jgi:hypothetical protein
MKNWALVSLVAVLVAAPAFAAPIIDNNHIYCWGDPDGDRYDNFATVAPGETIELEIWVNDLNGSVDIQPDPDYTLVNENWARAATGAATAVWWDSAVIDGNSVYENKLIPEHLDGDPATETTYYARRWGWTWGNSNLPHYFMRQYYGKSGETDLVGWVAEGKHVINVSFTVREDAPLGETKIGLEQMFYWDLFGGVYEPTPFFRERIESDDPFAMTLLIAPDGRLGDFDNDGDIDADDIDALAAAIQASSTDTIYDMDGDGDVDADDFAFHVHNLVDTALGEGTGTEFGDFNLDGMVSILDLGALGDGYGVGTGWAQGDANGDGTVGILDLGFLGDNYGYDGSAIPEPATMSLLGLGAVAILRRRR